ncbi:MAG: hydroxyacid dehydrogenase [Alphaproteobacteria bacterium]
MDEAAVNGLRVDFGVLHETSLVDRPEALGEALAGARALIVRNRTQVTEALLAQAPKLRVVGRLGVGLDNIDVASCKARGIAVCPATGANAIAVAEYVVGMILRLLRGEAHQASSGILAGKWPRNICVGHDAHGRTLGLLGLGAIAQEVAKRAKALGMTVAAHDPFVAPGNDAWNGVTRLDLPDLLDQSDVLSLHVPLNDGTHHIIDGAAIERMKESAILINTARGGVVDERALAEALRAGRLAGAALDVFEHEPVTEESSRHLREVPQLILTPHIAGVTDESNVLVSRVTAENVRRVLSRGAT